MGTSPTGYFPKYKLWYIELDQFSHRSMWLYLPPLNVVISNITQCGYIYQHSKWLSPYLHLHSVWFSLIPLNVVTVILPLPNVVTSITTQCGYLYHHSMWLFPPLPQYKVHMQKCHRAFTACCCFRSDTGMIS